MISKMQQKSSARPKNIKILFIVDWVNLVFVTLPSEHGHSLRLSRGRYDLTKGLVLGIIVFIIVLKIEIPAVSIQTNKF